MFVLSLFLPVLCFMFFQLVTITYRLSIVVLSLVCFDCVCFVSCVCSYLHCSFRLCVLTCLQVPLDISRVITTCLTTAINGHDDKLNDIVELIPYTEEFVSTVATITPVCLCMFVFSFSTAVFVCSLVGQPRN